MEIRPGGGRFLCRAAGLLRREDRNRGCRCRALRTAKRTSSFSSITCAAPCWQTARAIPARKTCSHRPTPQGNDPLAIVKQHSPRCPESCSISKLATQCPKAPARITRPPIRRSYASSPASREWSTGRTAWRSPRFGRAILLPAPRAAIARRVSRTGRRIAITTFCSDIPWPYRPGIRLMKP